MTIDINSRRRMVVNKFSNRPPFDLKNKEVPLSKHIENRKKSFENVDKSFKSIMKHLDVIQVRESQSENNKTKNIIPKIIESFQKVTPKRQVVYLKHKKTLLASKDSSLQTLYRNNMSFGKHIPKHKIMKELLQNLESETYVTNNDSYHVVDTIPTKDSNLKTAGYSLKTKVDKTTSTSGLVWHDALNQCDNIPIKIIKSHKSLNKSRSRIPKRKDVNKRVDRVHGIGIATNEGIKQSNHSSDVQHFPIKENFTNSSRQSDIKKSKTNRRTCVREHTYILEGTEDDEKPDRKREKSFVQSQVEKFNSLHCERLPNPKTDVIRNQGWEKMKANMDKNYMGMMTSAKTNFPKMQTEISTTDNYDWSDTADITTDVKFPKETRNAMETLIQNSRKPFRAPLSKYFKYQDLELQPAIPDYVIDHSRISKGVAPHQTFKKQLSCSKNLLCDRGDHEGPCVNMPRTFPCGHTAHHKKRRTKKTC